MESSPTVEGRRIEVRGTVQGVGFRPWVYRIAHEEGIRGRVSNDARGVTIDAFGSAEALAAFLRRIESDPPPAAVVREVAARAIPTESTAVFEIVASRAEGERRVSIPADLASCPECLRELDDPGDRRHAYAFTNCTHCGPRYTIALDVPYDRPQTTMAGFA
ncbi:MAG: acylphosphatase, partial [Acidobacteriota bacterium]